MKTQQTDQRWDDIIFENRNKIYGAYAIRQGYSVNVVRALLLCVGAIAGIFVLSRQHSVKDLGSFIPPVGGTIPTAPSEDQAGCYSAEKHYSG